MSVGGLGISSEVAALAAADGAIVSGGTSFSGTADIFAHTSVFTPGRLVPEIKVSAADAKSQAKSMPERTTVRSDDEEKMVVNMAFSFCTQKRASFWERRHRVTAVPCLYNVCT
jgi:hypothetical protein